jgi:hypothetical protein
MTFNKVFIILLNSIILITYSPESEAITYADKSIVKKSGIIAIYHNTNPGMGYPNKPGCTGSKITQELIITAAHCVYKYKAEHIYVSDGSIINNGVGLIPIRDIIINPGYLKYVDTINASIYDIAILRTGENMSKEGIINLPNDTINRLAERNNMYIYGYGLNEKGEYPNKLLLARVNDLSVELKKFQINYTYDTDKLVPAGGYKENIKKFSGSCQGDSGGPLLFVNKKREYLIGIASYGVVREAATPSGYICTSDYATTYVRVLPNKEWIIKAAKILESKNIYQHKYKFTDPIEDSKNIYDLKNIYLLNTPTNITLISEFNDASAISKNIFLNYYILNEEGEKLLYNFNNQSNVLLENEKNITICEIKNYVINNAIYSTFDKKCLNNRFSLLVTASVNNKISDELYIGLLSISK